MEEPEIYIIFQNYTTRVNVRTPQSLRLELAYCSATLIGSDDIFELRGAAVDGLKDLSTSPK